MFQSEAGEVGRTYFALDDAVLVVAHDLLELQRSRAREVEVVHLIDEAALVRGDDREHAANPSIIEVEVHCGLYFWTRRSMLARFWKFSGTMSIPAMEIAKRLSKAET